MTNPTNPQSDKLPSPALAAHQLTKVYKSGELQINALRGVDFELYPNEMVVLLGASGSGKSTLLNILGGLDTPTSGRVIYQGHDLSKASDNQLTRFRRDHVGFVFQFYNLIPSLTALENVALVTEIAQHPISPLDALALVNMADRKDHFPAQLSGGEQQRVAIARAIAKQPDILLCDEPTGALDQQTGILVLEAIENINRQLGTATAVITHNTVVGDMAHRIVYISDGLISGSTVNTQPRPASELVW
ncbi:ABC transporter ATP-binding protein [Aliiglaciecola sp. LCG003]|uniref:ABC transporter ATP-binding protein n=1 Tax=Aliiglaciecola sp. LCG003 TaxID=3053655 RepID=UPI002572DBF0|nr:ABC transporter ATP-binding protein [Aliiglaciecola sp. LCG003]WJG10786.1 ABC transporter ATP-binding protein [Aliiglaciecola sp. LCG003]